MTWGLFVLILVIVFAVIALCYLNFSDFSYFMENYFIFILLIIFIILLFVIDFNNQVQITTYFQNVNTEKTLIYQVPYHSDTDITNIVNVAFTGLLTGEGTISVTNTQVNFDIDAMNVGDEQLLYANNDNTTLIFTITKTAEYQLTVTNNTAYYLDGYLTLTLLCTGSQSIESSFKRLD